MRHCVDVCFVPALNESPNIFCNRVGETMANGDGSANAPFGSPEFPNLLSGYVVQPPWSVAGVGYYVGVPTNITLKDPSTIAMAGVSIKGHEIDITGNNVTLNGYNFNGW